MTEIKTEVPAEKAGRVIKIPFGIKLALIVTMILLGAIWTITSLMAVMVSSEFIRSAEETNFDINSRAAAGVRERLYKIRAEALLLLDMDMVLGDTEGRAQQIRNIFFERDPAIAAVLVHEGQEIVNEAFFSYNTLSMETLRSWIAAEAQALARAQKGVPGIKNASPALGINLLAFFYPWQDGGEEKAVVIFFSPENLSEISGTGSNATIAVNESGEILVHPDFNQVLSGANISSNPLVDALRKAPGENVRTQFQDGDKRFVGAGHRIPLADAAVFSTMEYSLITEQITAVTRRNILLSITVLFLSVLVTWFFSKTITGPIKKLTIAAEKIGAGEFNLNLVHRSRDEIGTLVRRVNETGSELGQYFYAKNLVGRYNNREMTEKVMHNELNMEGEYVSAAVMVVNFANFDDFAETQTPPESLALLNSFITRIREHIEKNGGLVDSVTGRRIIAFWDTAPLSEENSGKPMLCLRSALAMRTAFWDLNIERESQGLAQLRMTCGISAGQVLTGCIGTSASSQFSIAGKVVDEAIRAAELCGSFAIDIVLTEAADHLAEGRIVTVRLAPDKNKAPLYSLLHLKPQENEKPRWPFTLDDLQVYFRKKRGQEPMADSGQIESAPELMAAGNEPAAEPKPQQRRKKNAKKKSGK